MLEHQKPIDDTGGKKIKREAPELLVRQFKFFREIAEENRPSNLKYIGPTMYEYDWVEGEHPRNQEEMWRAWEVLESQRVKVGEPVQGTRCREFVKYWQYVVDRWVSVQRDDRPKISMIIPSTFQMVAPVHGDCTLENILIKPNGVPVFIDPGNTKELDLAAQDRAKLMQSVITQYEAANRGWEYCGWDLPFEPDQMDWYLLLCHWIRLLAHPEKHTDKVERYGRNVVVPSLVELLNNGKEIIRVRPRWCANRFQAECVSRLQKGVY